MPKPCSGRSIGPCKRGRRPSVAVGPARISQVVSGWLYLASAVEHGHALATQLAARLLRLLQPTAQIKSQQLAEVQAIGAQPGPRFEGVSVSTPRVLERAHQERGQQAGAVHGV